MRTSIYCINSLKQYKMRTYYLKKSNGIFMFLTSFLQRADDYSVLRIEMKILFPFFMGKDCNARLNGTGRDSLTRRETP